MRGHDWRCSNRDAFDARSPGAIILLLPECLACAVAPVEFAHAHTLLYDNYNNIISIKCIPNCRRSTVALPTNPPAGLNFVIIALNASARLRASSTYRIAASCVSSRSTRACIGMSYTTDNGNSVSSAVMPGLHTTHAWHSIHLWLQGSIHYPCALGTFEYRSFRPMAQCVVHALKGLACRARATPASSPASHCKQYSALTSPALHARGCTSPSRARHGHKNYNICFNGSKT